MLHIGTLSSGAGSAYACKLMIDEVGRGVHVQTIFTDTLVEDEDNYRFLDEIVEHLQVTHWRIADGRTPLELAWKKRALPSDRMPFCSEKLKREPLERYIEELRDGEGEPFVTIWWGIGIEEAHRAVNIGRNWYENYNVLSRFPLIEQGVIHSEPFEWLQSIGITRPRMYDEGFTHANCGLQGCVRAGLNTWALMWEKRPEAYLRSEALEQRWQKDFNKNYTILRIQRNKSKVPISLKDFREQYLEGKVLFPDDPIDGACGCMATFEGKT